MSVFIAIMKGEWDGLLDWPFGLAVKMSLLDQSESLGQRKNIDFTVVPNRIKVRQFVVDKVDVAFLSD